MTYYAIIIDDRSGEEVERHTLDKHDILDCDIWARAYASSLERELHETTKHVPTGCADFTVTLTQQPGGVRNWDSKSYFLEDKE